MYGNRFLPAEHQGSSLYPNRKEPPENVSPKESDAAQRRRLEIVGKFDREFLTATEHDGQVEAAYRIQSSVPG